MGEGSPLGKYPFYLHVPPCPAGHLSLHDVLISALCTGAVGVPSLMQATCSRSQPSTVAST